MKLNRKVKFTSHTRAVDVTVDCGGGVFTSETRFVAMVVRHSPDRKKREVAYETPPLYVTRLAAYEAARHVQLEMGK